MIWAWRESWEQSPGSCCHSKAREDDVLVSSGGKNRRNKGSHQLWGGGRENNKAQCLSHFLIHSFCGRELGELKWSKYGFLMFMLSWLILIRLYDNFIWSCHSFKKNWIVGYTIWFSPTVLHWHHIPLYLSVMTVICNFILSLFKSLMKHFSMTM